MKKKRTAKHFVLSEICLQLQCLVNYSVDFLELSMFLNSFLLLTYLIKWSGVKWTLEKKLLFLYRYFLKTVTDEQK